MWTERDKLWLDEFEANVKDSSNTATEAEADILATVQEELGNIPQSSWTSIDDDLFFPKDKAQLADGEGKGIGRCMGTVQTLPERLLGW